MSQCHVTALLRPRNRLHIRSRTLNWQSMQWLRPMRLLQIWCNRSPRSLHRSRRRVPERTRSPVFVIHAWRARAGCRCMRRARPSMFVVPTVASMHSFRDGRAATPPMRAAFSTFTSRGITTAAARWGCGLRTQVGGVTPSATLTLACADLGCGSLSRERTATPR